MDEAEWRYLLAGPTGEIKILDNPTSFCTENQWPDMYRQINGLGLLENF
jgi:dynein heavy chain